MRRAVSPLALACFALLLAGCATRAPITAPSPEAWWTHQQGLRSLQAFQIDGRVAAAGQPGSGQLRWVQGAGGVFDIRVSGPLGSGSLRLRGTLERVLIEDRAGRRESLTPEAELEALLGSRLPLDALVYWARGLPQPGVAARYALDAAGRLQQLLQGGWQLDYAAYHGGEPSLPRRIELRRPGTEITLLLDRWQALP
jgi:outer membrane lipoprotein LolB